MLAAAPLESKPPPFGTPHRVPVAINIPPRLLPPRRDSLPSVLSTSPGSPPSLSLPTRSPSLNASWPSSRTRGQVRFDDTLHFAPAIPPRPLSRPSRASKASGFPAGLHEFLLAPMPMPVGPEPHQRRRTDMLPFGPLDSQYVPARSSMPTNWNHSAFHSLDETRRRRRASDALFAQKESESITSILDLCARTLCARLDLSLVYILALRLPTPPATVPPNACKVLALTQMSPYPPSFHIELHFRALRNEQGGLLYRKVPGSDGSPYEAGIILPVSEADGIGIVLAGFSVETGRALDAGDLDVFEGVARQVRVCVANASGAGCD